jgi:hypothetical protein
VSIEKKAHELAAACIDQIASDCIDLAKDTTVPLAAWDRAGEMRSAIVKRLEEYRAEGMQKATELAARV